MPTIYFFSKKQEKCHIFSSDNSSFYSREKLQYIAWAYYRNGGMQIAAIARINEGLNGGPKNH